MDEYYNFEWTNPIVDKKMTYSVVSDDSKLIRVSEDKMELNAGEKKMIKFYVPA